MLSLLVAGMMYNRLTINRLKRKLDAYDRLLQLSQRPEGNGDGDGDGDEHPPNLRLIQGGVVAGTTALALEWARQHPKASALVALATAAGALGLAASVPSGPGHHPRLPVALPPAISVTPTPTAPAAPTSEPAPPSAAPKSPSMSTAVPVNYSQRSRSLAPRRPPTTPPATTRPAETKTPSGTPTPTPTLPPISIPPSECDGVGIDIPALVEACLLD